jgi:putative phage-type endonuclease
MTAKRRIGSSDIAAIAGLNKFKTPLEVWAEFTGRIERPAQNQAMMMGKMAEPILAELYKEKSGKEIVLQSVKYPFPEHDGFVAVPDGLRFNAENKIDGLVELKTVNFRGLGDWEDGNAPDHYALQVHWQMGCFPEFASGEWTSSHLFAVVGWSAAHQYLHEIKYDALILNQLIDIGNNFLKHVADDTPPAASADDTKLIERLGGELREVTAELDSAMLAEFEEYSIVHAKIKDLEKALKPLQNRKKAIENQIMLAAKGANRAICGKHEALIKRIKRTAYQAQGCEYTQIKIIDGGNQND